MITIKKLAISYGAGLALMMIMALVGTTSAFADGGGGSLTSNITAGSTLTVAEVGALPTLSTTLDGTDKTMSFGLPLLVTDGRGSGLGWKLTASATQFALITGAGGTSVLHVLPASMSITSVSQSACNVASECTLPGNSASLGNIGAATAINTGGILSYNTDGTSVNFLNAAVGTGLGAINLTPNFTQAVPLATYAGSYSGSLTIATTTGP